MQLHEFITENMEPIMQEWVQFTKTLPPGKHMTVGGLRDHAQKILDAIVVDMSEPQSEDEQESKSKGREKDSRLQQSAQRHVGTRLLEGFDFDQIVSEYRALRASVIRLWTEQIKSADKETLYHAKRWKPITPSSMPEIARYLLIFPPSLWW